jgi:hypothetical protein
LGGRRKSRLPSPCPGLDRGRLLRR